MHSTDSDHLRFLSDTFSLLYPSPKPFLQFQSRYQLLVAVILSAKCTDKMVNIVTRKLFSDCSGPEEILALGKDSLVKYIRSCGCFNSKSKHIIAMTKKVLSEFEGEVPGDFEALLTLPGVGEKTAGVVLAQGFGEAAFPVDTHIYRVARRLGISKANTANKVSSDLKKCFPKELWIDLHLQMIMHGRMFCTARNPKCKQCAFLHVCHEGKSRRSVDH